MSLFAFVSIIDVIYTKYIYNLLNINKFLENYRADNNSTKRWYF